MIVPKHHTREKVGLQDAKLTLLPPLWIHIFRCESVVGRREKILTYNQNLIARLRIRIRIEEI